MRHRVTLREAADKYKVTYNANGKGTITINGVPTYLAPSLPMARVVVRDLKAGNTPKYDIDRWRITPQAAQDTPEANMDEALWWVSRYVTGSMDDPAWDFGSPTTLTVAQAFEVVAKFVGNHASINKPLFRYALLDSFYKPQTLKKLPRTNQPFLSFTTVGTEGALEIGREIHHTTAGKTEVVVSLKGTPDLVLFGTEDLKRHRHPGVRDLYDSLADWHHQGEVFVRQPYALPVVVTWPTTPGRKTCKDGACEIT